MKGLPEKRGNPQEEKDDLSAIRTELCSVERHSFRLMRSSGADSGEAKCSSAHFIGLRIHTCEQCHCSITNSPRLSLSGSNECRDETFICNTNSRMSALSAQIFSRSRWEFGVRRGAALETPVRNFQDVVLLRYPARLHLRPRRPQAERATPGNDVGLCHSSEKVTT